MLPFIGKHVLIGGVLLVLYPFVSESFGDIRDQQTLNTLLLFVGLIIVAPLFAFFQFSYEFTKPGVLFVSHFTTGAALAVIGILLVMVDVLFLRLVGDMVIFRGTLLLFYLACIGYDTWDFARFKGLS